MIDRLWKSLQFWEWIEFAAGLGGAVGSFIGACAQRPNITIASALSGAVIMSLAKLRGKAIDREAKQKKAEFAKRTIGVLLEQCRKDYFREVDGEWHHHRVTLFVCRTEKKTNSRYLAIYERAGVYGTSSTVWPVNDDAAEKCSGVAGRIWFLDATKVIKTTNTWPTDAGDVAGRLAYATETFTTVEHLENVKMFSTTFVGTTIRVTGKKWGVLLLDSTKEVATKQKNHVVERYAASLAAILAEAEL